VVQAAHITCKEDQSTVIQNTVAKKLDEGYACIKRSQLVVVWNAAEERSIVKVVPNDWGTIQLANDDGMVVSHLKEGSQPYACVSRLRTLQSRCMYRSLCYL
jgi:uncharacterized membrane protein